MSKEVFKKGSVYVTDESGVITQEIPHNTYIACDDSGINKYITEDELNKSIPLGEDALACIFMIKTVEITSTIKVVVK